MPRFAFPPGDVAQEPLEAHGRQGDGRDADEGPQLLLEDAVPEVVEEAEGDGGVGRG